MALATPYPDPIPGIIPFGTVTILAGAAGVGKTAMWADWMVRMRDGRTICGYPTNAPTGFYYIAADRQWASHQIWFDAVGYPDIAHYSLADDHAVDLTDLQKPHLAYSTFLGCLNKLNPIPGSHVIVDPASPLFIPGDPNKQRDVAAGMLRFSRLCSQRQINITCMVHFGKQKSDPKEQYSRPQDRIAGSGAFAGFSDTQIYLINPQPPKQPYHILGWVPRHAKPEEFHFERNEKGLFRPFGLYQELDRLETVRAAIPDGPTATSILIAVIQSEMNVSIQQAERHLSALVQDGFLIKLRRGLYTKAKPA